MSDTAARRAVLLVILGSAAVRLWLAAATGLGYDESYMVGNARWFSLSYVDHPPLHVWLVWLAQTAAQSEAPVVVRTPFILLFAGSTWLMYRLTARLFGPAAGVWAVVAFNLAPVFSLADASWVLPDGPLIFFLLAAANVLAHILFDEAPLMRPVLWWIAAGVLGGLALLSKYNAVFFFAGVFVWLLTIPSARRHLATPGPWLGLAAAIVVFSPAIVWNITHGFAGAAFQTSRVGGASFSVLRGLQDIGGQFLYLMPLLAVPFAISLIRALATGRSDPKAWLLALLAVGPIVVFTLAALVTRSLPHWSMPGWLFAIPLFGRDATALALRRPVFARAYMGVVGAVFAVSIAAFVAQATRGTLIPRDIIAANPAADPTIDLVDWHALGAALAERGLAGPDLVVAAPHWLYAGKASYALGPDVPVLCLCDNPQHFAYRDDPSRWSGRDVVVVAPVGEGRLREAAALFFDTLEPLEPVAIMRGGEEVLALELRLGRNLKFP